MNKEEKKQVKKYCFDIGKQLTCSRRIKKVFISELKSRIYDFSEEHPEEELTRSRLEDRFGSPWEIVQSFFSENDLNRLKKKAWKCMIYKISAATAIIIAVIALAIIIFAIKDADHSISTSVDLITKLHLNI